MPERIELADREVGGAYFLRRERPGAAPFVESLTGDGSYRHCMTYIGSDRSIRRELLAMIRAARQKIFVASFLIGDTEMADALFAAASRLRGGVYVISQLDEKRLRRGLAELDDELGVDLKAQKKRFDEMTRHGIFVRGHANCHAKFVVVDDEIALVTSANLMTRALDETGENGVVITDRIEVDRLARLYARLWHAGCEWEAYPGEAYALRERTPESWPAMVPAPTVSSRPGVIWTDGAEHYILDTIRDLVSRAKRELLIASFSLNGLRQHKEVLLDDLLAALDRGVEMRMVIRPRRHVDGHLADAETLAAAGAQVHGDMLTHAKAVIADGEAGALFSANLDTHHGLTSGVEVGCRLDDVAAMSEAKRYLDHAFNHAALAFTVNPTHRELSTRLDAAWRVKWPLADRIRLVAPASERDAFNRGVNQGPVLFAGNSSGAVDMYVGTRRWRLTSTSTPGRFELRSASTSTAGTSATLARWLQSAEDNSPRGICPATIEWTDSDGSDSG